MERGGSGRRRLVDRLRAVPDDPEALAALEAEAEGLFREGRRRAARRRYRRVLRGRRRLLGDDHPDTILCAWQVAYLESGRDGEERARGQLEAIASGRSQALGAGHRDTIAAMRSLVICSWDSAVVLEWELDEVRGRLGDEHPDTLFAVERLADYHRFSGDLRIARRLHEQNLRDCGRILGLDHERTMASLRALVDVRCDQGDARWAAAVARDALDRGSRPAAPQTLWALVTLVDVGQILSNHDQTEGAAWVQEETLARFRLLDTGPEIDLERFLLQSDLASSLFELDRYEEVRAHLHQALEGLAGLSGPDAAIGTINGKHLERALDDAESGRV